MRCFGSNRSKHYDDNVKKHDSFHDFRDDRMGTVFCWTWSEVSRLRVPGLALGQSGNLTSGFAHSNNIGLNWHQELLERVPVN